MTLYRSNVQHCFTEDAIRIFITDVIESHLSEKRRFNVYRLAHIAAILYLATKISLV